MSRIAPVLNVLSRVVMLFALTLLVPLTVSWIVDDGAQRAYDDAILITFASGVAIWLLTRKARRGRSAGGRRTRRRPTLARGRTASQ